jgi:hypothetical protein
MKGFLYEKVLKEKICIEGIKLILMRRLMAPLADSFIVMRASDIVQVLDQQDEKPRRRRSGSR